MLSPEQLSELSRDERMAYIDGVCFVREILGTFRNRDYREKLLNDPGTPERFVQKRDPRLRKYESLGVGDALRVLRGGGAVRPSGYAMPPSSKSF